jgi:hypothetical protein
MSQPDRALWVDQAAATLAAHLTGYTADECRTLAELLHDIGDRPVVGTMDRTEQILYLLLRQQGLDEPSALIVARVFPHIDWSRLFIGSRAVFGLLDATPSDLLKYRRSDSLVPAIEHRGEARIETIAYSLADILLAMAMERLSTERGAGKRRFWWR